MSQTAKVDGTKLKTYRASPVPRFSYVIAAHKLFSRARTIPGAMDRLTGSILFRCGYSDGHRKLTIHQIHAPILDQKYDPSCTRITIATGLLLTCFILLSISRISSGFHSPAYIVHAIANSAELFPQRARDVQILSHFTCASVQPRCTQGETHREP